MRRPDLQSSGRLYMPAAAACGLGVKQFAKGAAVRTISCIESLGSPSTRAVLQ